MSTLRHACLLATAIVLLGACASQPEPFVHTFRDDYTLEHDELKTLQFYVSGNVLVQREDSSPQSLLLTRGTPGVCTLVGPDWLRISFRESGFDIPFVSARRYGRYWLATEVAGGQPYRRVKDLQHKAITVDGVTYTLVRGHEVFLMVDPESLQDLIEKRVVTTDGRTVGG